MKFCQNIPGMMMNKTVSTSDADISLTNQIIEKPDKVLFIYALQITLSAISDLQRHSIPDTLN